MFRPVCMLQFGAMLCLVAGCVSGTPRHDLNQPDEAPISALAPADPRTAGSGPTADKPISLPELPAAAPSIQSGSSTPAATGFTTQNDQLKPDIKAYAEEVARTRNIPQPDVLDLLQSANYNPTVARLMSPSKTRVRPSWSTYRARFVEPVRMKAGLEFWQEHEQQLNLIESRYGVPAEIIVAIIGVETIFGRYTGDFRVLDALATLGFRYPDPSRPERSQLFRDQLADLAQLHHENKINAYTATGSFAGAMGLPQFMPGSLLRYATDGDGDGQIDLMHNTTDAMASVAQFLRYHGWVPGLPVFAPVQLPDDPGDLVAGGIDPTLTWSALVDKGATVRSDTYGSEWQNHLMGVIDLKDEPRNTVEFRTGTPNFFAITHYNRSYFYATSVAELAAALAQRMGRQSN